MKKLVLLGAALAVGALGLQDISVGHGGTYRGPGDTVPPGGGGGGGGGGPATPGPAGPSNPGGSGPSTPGPAAPGNPGSGPSTPSAPSSGGGGDSGSDLTIWQFWWGFNKDPYLNLKAHLHSGATQSGSDEAYLGLGQQQQSRDSLRPSEDAIRGKIVPALIAALERESNNDIVTACLIALAKIGDAKTEQGESRFETLIKARLRDPVQEIRETAAVALGILANPASIQLLEDILMDTQDGRRAVGEDRGINYRTRAFAAYGLGLIGHGTNDREKRERIVERLWEILESPRMATRDVKVGAVIAMGLVPLDLAPSATEGEAREASKPWQSREAQIAYLLQFFQDENNPAREFLVRAHAPRSVALLLDGAPKALKEDAAKQFLKYVGRRAAKAQNEIQQSCVLALGQIGDLDNDSIDKEIRTALIETAEGSGDQQIKHYAMIALGQVGGRPGDGDAPTAGIKELRSALLKHLSRSRGRIKPWTGLAIGVMERGLLDAGEPQGADALSALRSTLNAEKNPEDVGAYAIALGIARDVVDSQDLLLEKLNSFSQNEARGDIAVALGLMNAVRAIEPIQDVVKRSRYRPELLKSAAIALGLLGDKTIATELETMLREEAKTLTTQAAVASALGFIGDSRSIDPLIKMLQDDSLTQLARAFAAVALGIVADKEPLPWNSKISVDLNYRATTVTLTSFEQGTGILDIL